MRPQRVTYMDKNDGHKQIRGCSLYATSADTNNSTRIQFQTCKDRFSRLGNRTVLKHGTTRLVWYHSDNETIRSLRNHIRKLCRFELIDVGCVHC